MNFSPEINLAIVKATIAHREQKRKEGDIPYIVHPIAVAWIVAQYTDSKEAVCAALLHDVLEDVSAEIYSAADILSDFGQTVLDIIKGVSEDKDASLTEEEAVATWLERKQKYLQNLEQDSKDALIVCAADKIHNMQSAMDAIAVQGEKFWDLFNSTKANKIWYYSSVLEIIKRRLNNPIVAELEKVYMQYKELVLGSDLTTPHKDIINHLIKDLELSDEQRLKLQQFSIIDNERRNLLVASERYPGTEDRLVELDQQLEEMLVDQTDPKLSQVLKDYLKQVEQARFENEP